MLCEPDPAQRTQPVMGADDGASGVAVLLELARTLDVLKTQREIWLAFFDTEDDGRLDGWDWIIGSTRLADSLTVTPISIIPTGTPHTTLPIKSARSV